MRTSVWTDCGIPLAGTRSWPLHQRGLASSTLAPAAGPWSHDEERDSQAHTVTDKVDSVGAANCYIPRPAEQPEHFHTPGVDRPSARSSLAACRR